MVNRLGYCRNTSHSLFWVELRPAPRSLEAAVCKCLCGLQQGRGPLQRHARHAPTLHTDSTYISSTPRCRTHALHPSLLSAHATSSTDIHHLRSMTHHIRRSWGRATFRKRGEIISIRRVKEVMSGEWGRGEELREDFWSFFFFYKVISTGVAEVGMF